MILGRLLLLLLIFTALSRKRITRKRTAVLSALMLGIPFIILFGYVQKALQSGMLTVPAFEGKAVERPRRGNGLNAGLDAFADRVARILEK